MGAEAFPLPRDGDDSLPAWAWGIIGASIGVTLLWLVAITFLIVYEVTGRVRREERPRTPRVFEPARQLSSPPPPVPAPERRSSRPSSRTPSRQPSVRSQVDTAASIEKPTKTALEVPSTDPFEKPDKEYRLSLLVSSPEDDSLSLTSSEEDGKPIHKSMSVHKRPDAASPPQTYLSGDELSPAASPRTSPSGTLTGMVLSRPVTVRQLGATIREPNYIESEFRKLPNPAVSNEDIPPGAERKNRYSNVLPSPRTRVHLALQFGRPNSDYINANYIRGYKNHPRQYIATQGPLDSTVEDFWRMVWENDCDVIVMATNFQERGIEKCARYWPAQGSEEFDSLEVSLVQQTAYQNYSSATLLLRNLDTNDARSIRHYRLTCWPHQGVPKTTKPITDFLREVKMADSSGPAVVHCSAGIGRTGVLIATDIAIQGILQGDPKIDVLRIVSTMRQDRAGMVQTKDQYRFIHQALYDVAREVGPQL